MRLTVVVAAFGALQSRLAQQLALSASLSRFLASNLPLLSYYQAGRQQSNDGESERKANREKQLSICTTTTTPQLWH